ncbi:MAG: N-6 DNA methylase [Caldilineaceae bacterium]|nr:N-6 DNA methylase [Caldilineaceae bacterium]
MLDVETRRRIDTARDILVGKVPDPKSQVEQITIALIYKFMDDMDAEAEELGGARSFFTGEFAQYGWSRLMAPNLGGFDVLNLYAEAITRMDENAGIPQLFRTIFRNAFLPYRDPETLKSFLKVIDDFEYDHSERLGDAFEYLLSVLGSQGDAGQFRTPRHIIDFMVEIINPQKHETILDPACGTAGFLISAYKQILKQNSSNYDPQATHNGASGNGGRYAGDRLTPDERTRLAQNVRGYDISPDMVRLSLVNLYLHGFAHPNVVEYDTLTSEERWHEYADVILANPPFMSPKGGIKPHKRFSVQSKRSEVLFVDYMAEHLTPNGRAAIIVPEGIIFQSQNAYKQLRQTLVERYLFGVISLPAGVFQPYSGVKTSILLLDRTLARQSEQILFVKVENDGFDLGAQRRPIAQNDLPAALNAIQAYLQSVRNGAPFDPEQHTNVLVVEKERIGENGEWNLSGERYRVDRIENAKWNYVEVGAVCRKSSNNVLPKSIKGGVEYVGLENISQHTGQLIGETFVTDPAQIKSTKTRFQKGQVLYGKLRPNLNKVWLADRSGICSTDIYVIDAQSPTVDLKYCSHVLRGKEFNKRVLAGIKGAQLPRVGWKYFSSISIPLPPLDVQRAIVGEIEGYQRIIDGARAVVDSYKPQIQIDPEWKMVELGEVFQTKSGTTPKRSNSHYYKDGTIPWVKTLDLTDGAIQSTDELITQQALDETTLKIMPQGTVLIAMYGGFNQIGRTGVLEIRAAHNQAMTALLPCKQVNPYFLNTFLISSKEYWKTVANSTRKDPNIKKQDVLKLKFPLPDLETQERIVAQIEREQVLVNANKELITLFEQKIQETIARVWCE